MTGPSTIAILLSVLVLAPLVPVPVLADEITLRRHPVRLVDAREDGQRYWYDDRVPNAEAKSLLRYFRKHAEDPMPVIFAVPGMDGYFVVQSSDDRSTESDYGGRLYLVRRSPGGYEDIDRMRGAADSYILRPVFFTGQGKILILAETGTEYAWGLMVYEIAGKRLTFLGHLAAAVEGENDAEDPTPFATVNYANGRWRVEFAHDLVLDPGGPKDRAIRRKGKQPIVFEHDGERFVPTAGTYSDVTDERL